MAQRVSAPLQGNLSATLAGTTAFTESGFGPAAAAVIISCEANTTNNPHVGAGMSVGLWDGTNQRAAGIIFHDAQGTTASFRSSDDSFGMLSNIVSGGHTAYTVSATTDGIVLTNSIDTTSVQRHCTVLLFSGISAKLVTVAMNATQNLTVNTPSLGFAPKFAFVLSLGAAGADVLGATSPTLSFGFAEIGGKQRAAIMSGLSAAADETTSILFSETRCAVDTGQNAVVWSADATAWNADDITFTTRDGASASNVIFVLALGGADLSYDCDTLTTPTSTGVATTATTIMPQALVMAQTTASSTTIATTATGADGLTFSIGGISGGVPAGFAHAIAVADGAGTTDSESTASSGMVEIRTMTGGSQALVSGSLSGMNTRDFQTTYGAVSATARKCWWAGFGPVGRSRPLVNAGLINRGRINSGLIN